MVHRERTSHSTAIVSSGSTGSAHEKGQCPLKKNVQLNGQNIIYFSIISDILAQNELVCTCSYVVTSLVTLATSGHATRSWIFEVIVINIVQMLYNLNKLRR